MPCRAVTMLAALMLREDELGSFKGTLKGTLHPLNPLKGTLKGTLNPLKGYKSSIRAWGLACRDSLGLMGLGLGFGVWVLV